MKPRLKIYRPPNDGLDMVQGSLPSWPTILILVAMTLALLAILFSPAAEPGLVPSSTLGQPVAERQGDLERAHTPARSTKWPAVRAAHLAKQPVCEACGSAGSKAKPLQVHHVIPFAVAGNDDADGDGITNELDHDNLITLCIDGVGHCDCHLLIGHGGNFKCHNPHAVRDAKRFREMLSGKVCDRK